MANSFKQMIKNKTISRSDTGMFISLDDIHVKEGFNHRIEDEYTQAADDETYSYLMSGGTVPPLEVVPREEGGVWVVEGHRRLRCFKRCRDAGKPVNRIHIMPFVGNDIERTARIMTSNNQLPLRPMEQAAVVRKLAAFNLTTAEIAKLVGKSAPTVEKLLTLSTANHDVQQIVKTGSVSLDVAVERVKEHGERAGEVLEKDVQKAQAEGRRKVTRRVIKPEISISKARRVVVLISQAEMSDEGIVTLAGADFAELAAIIDEHRALSATETD